VNEKKDLVILIQDVSTSRSQALTTVARLSTQQGDFKPSPEEWSIREVVEHLVLAEVSGVAKIWEAIESTRAGGGWNEENPNRGLTIEQIVARTWQPKIKAPPIATPHMGGPLAYWMAAFRNSQTVLQALGVELARMDLESVIFPHFLCGPLDARQRLEFLRFHIDRHIGQILRIRQSPGFPSA